MSQDVMQLFSQIKGTPPFPGIAHCSALNHDFFDPEKTRTFILSRFIRNVPDIRRIALLRILTKYHSLFMTAPGSSHNHQAWPGGYTDHLTMLFRLSWPMYKLMHDIARLEGRELPFTLGSVQVILFFHDPEKLFRYIENDLTRPVWQHCADHGGDWESYKMKVLLPQWEKEYGFTLTEAEKQAIHYIHGEGNDYRKDQRVMSELAAFCHVLDVTSARLLHDYGAHKPE